MQRRNFIKALAAIPILGTVPAFAVSEVRRLFSKNVLVVRVKIAGMEEIRVVRHNLPDKDVVYIEHFSIAWGPEHEIDKCFGGDCSMISEDFRGRACALVLNTPFPSVLG